MSALGTLRSSHKQDLIQNLEKLKLKYLPSSEDFWLRRAPSHKLLFKTHRYSFE